MKYLNSTPFHSNPATDEYIANYPFDAVKKWCKCQHRASLHTDGKCDACGCESLQLTE